MAFEIKILEAFFFQHRFVLNCLAVDVKDFEVLSFDTITDFKVFFSVTEFKVFCISSRIWSVISSTVMKSGFKNSTIFKWNCLHENLVV